MRLALPCLVLLALAAAPTAWADPPPWAPAHGWRARHHYTYYPSGEIYYAPESRLWFWLDGSRWRSGMELPLSLHALIRTGGVSIELDSERPYVEHRYVVEHYGGDPADRFEDDDGYRGRDSDEPYDDDEGDDGDRGRRHGHGRHGH